jgi:hypothetical protein
MLSMPNFAVRRDPIYLTDEKLEHSDVVETLLDIMYTLKTANIDTSVMFAVLDLAEKWDFDHVRHTIRRDLSYHGSNEYMFHHFQLSTQFKDPSLIASFVTRGHDVIWDDDQSCSLIEYFARQRLVRQVYDEPAPDLLNQSDVVGSRMFEVGTWSYGNFLLTPPTVLWALSRATYVGTTTPAKIDHKKVADEFERLLKLACKLSGHWTQLIHRRA